MLPSPVDSACPPLDHPYPKHTGLPHRRPVPSPHRYVVMDYMESDLHKIIHSSQPLSDGDVADAVGYI